MGNISLVLKSAAAMDAAQAAGVPLKPGGTYEACPFVVGDFIAYPGGVTYRVTWRMYATTKPGETATWYVGIEPAANPAVSEAARQSGA
jgi:hypothetical protein